MGIGAVLVGAMLAAAAPPSPLGIEPARSRPTRRQLETYIDAAATAHGVRRELVWAVIQAESSFDHDVVSPSGAVGLMQLMPATAERFGAQDPLDARQNIFAGTRFLKRLLDTYAGDVSLSAAAYNAGETAVARFKGIPPYRATRAYVKRVTTLLDDLMPDETPRAGLYSVEMTVVPCPALGWGAALGWPLAGCPALAALQRQ